MPSPPPPLSGQVIFLHWFHHVTVLLYCWHAYTATPAATGLWFAAMNYTVHSVMYMCVARAVFFDLGGAGGEGWLGRQSPHQRMPRRFIFILGAAWGRRVGGGWGGGHHISACRGGSLAQCRM